MKAEATAAAVHDLRAAHSGSVLGEPPTAERPRWRSAAEPAELTQHFELKREPSDSAALLRTRDARRSEYESYESYESNYDDHQQLPADAHRPRYAYDADRRVTNEAPSQAWGSAQRFAPLAGHTSTAYSHHAAEYLPPPLTAAAAASYYEHHCHQPHHYQQPPHYHHPQQLYRQPPPYEHDPYTSRQRSAASRHRHDEDDDLDDDDDGRVVVHLQEPPAHRHPLKKTRRHAPSSLRSTSNSSAQSSASIDGEALDDDEYAAAAAHRCHHLQDTSEDEDEDEAEDTEDNDAYERSGRLNPPRLSPEIYEDHELHSDFRHMLHMLIPTNAFGCLVGSRGAIIRQINAQTRCTLSIRDGAAFALEDDAEHRVLRIYGKPKGICLAQHLVLDRIRAHRAKKLDPLYTPLTLQSEDVLVPLSDASVPKSMSSAVAAPRHKRGASANADAAAAAAAAGASHAAGTLGPVKWLLRSDDVGRIMGANGAIMRAIARDTNTKIHVTPTVDMPRGSKERLVTILGPPSADFAAARAAIERLAGGRPEAQAGESKDSQYFAIPARVVGALIGPQGKTSRWLTEQSGVRLQIPQSEHLPLGYVNRVLHMQGTRTQVEHAYVLVRTKIRHELERLAAERDDDETHVGLKVLVPSRVADAMLSQRGRLVQEISDKSGAHAHFLPAHGSDLRVCLIAGDLAAALRAERLVLQLVAGDLIATQRSGGGGVLPRGKRKRAGADDALHVDADVDDDDGRGDEADAPARPPVVRGGRPNPRSSDGRLHAARRRPQPNARATGRQSDRSSGRRLPTARAKSSEEKRDLVDRLQAPLQSARHVDASHKRQRR